MKSKAIFFDLDNTLWNEAMLIPQSTMDAVRQLHENGHKLFVCTGRARGNLRQEQLFTLPFDGIIAACGNYIEIDGQVIYENLIEPELLKLAIDTMNACRMPMVLEGSYDHWISNWGFETDPYVTYLFQTLGESAHVLYGYEEGMRINKISTLILPETDYKTIKETLSGHLTFLEHPYDVLEILPHRTSKALGIERVCRELGLQREDTYGLGDSVNDLEMLSFVGHGIAMGDGQEAAKQAAEYVTAGVNEDGVYLAMKHYGLL